MAALNVSGGDKLEAFLKKVAKSVSNPGTLRVGFLEGSTNADGVSIPMYAAINEFGSGNVPSRPFFRDMIQTNSEKWPLNVVAALKITDYDATRALQIMGEEIKGELDYSIRNGSYAPLADSTIARKGFDKPLIDKADMVNSINYEIQ